MFYVDRDKCTGCGLCADVCSRRAISIRDNVAVIDTALCAQCGDCAPVCPSGAIKSRASVYAESVTGGDTMRGRGYFGGSRGSGFGFRGSSPPWPYVGRGRGGLPRCYYPGLPPGPQLSAEQEIGFLREEASTVKRRLEDIEARIKELESD